MDDLFRKAADDYPLSTIPPDWNKFAGMLARSGDAAGSLPGAASVAGSKKYRRFLWLLLLIPVLSVSGYLYYQNKNADKISERAKNISDSVNSVTNKTTEATAKNQFGLSGDELNKVKTEADDNTQNSADLPVDNTELKSTTGAKENSVGRSTVKHTITSDNKISDKTFSRISKSKKASDPKIVSKTSMKKQAGSINKSSANSNGTLLSGQVSTIGGRVPANTDAFSSPEAANPVGITDLYQSPAITGFFPIEDSTEKDISYAPKPQQERLPQQKKFYIAAMGGVDLTNVRFQKINNIGSQYGGLAGYQFSKKWSIELGFFVDKKYYYTDAEYYDKSGINVNPNSKVLWVDGNCLMFEIPVSVKYDITNTYRSNWFVTAGLSSYFMKKEKYDMLYLYTSSGSTAVHDYEYKNSDKSYFSQLRLTGGYTYKLPRNFGLRIEPYFNLPVSGIGSGKLKLVSAGLNAGIVKRLF
ncbi:MAG: hypothetical protein ABW036_10100 [Flavitalea sp.]